jgi:hypothetical protein
MNAILIFAVLFFAIDVKYYKPKNFLTHKTAVAVLFLHHLLFAFVLVGFVMGYRSRYLYVGILIVILLGWQVFDDKCLLSIITKKCGPENEAYCPYVGPFHLLAGNAEKCAEQYCEKA